jgi:hypothetical protein
MKNSVEKCRLFQQNTQKADISLRSNILPNVNTKLKWKTQMKNTNGKLSREVSTFSNRSENDQTHRLQRDQESLKHSKS